MKVQATELTPLIGLNEKIRADIHAGEPAIAVDPSVDANATGLDGRSAVLLSGVSAQESFAREMRLHIMEAPPEEPVIALFSEREGKIDTGMGKDVPIAFKVTLAARHHEIPMGLRHRRPFWHGGTRVAFHGGTPANGQPRLEVDLLLFGIEHQNFMIADEWHQAGLHVESDQSLQNAFGVWPTVHIVAKSYERVFFARRELIQQNIQSLGTAVYVANDQRAHEMKKRESGGKGK
jgi:hypothetical protein